MENGCWAYRFTVKVDGVTITQRKTVDADGLKFRTKTDAIKARAAALQEAVTQRVKKKRTCRHTIKEVFEEFCENGRNDRAYRTIQKQDSLWRNHLCERIGKRFCDDVSPAEVIDYLCELYYVEGFSYQYTERFLKMFYLIFGQAHILQQMQQMEERYAYEDRLMEIVASRSTNQAELLLSSVSRLNFQPRTSDPLRNQKNYCIICNTLLCKAAQRGGVHPFHIDKMSSRFARSIENAATLSQCSAILGEMIASYCHLVHSQTRTRYSPAIQKVISYIQANVSGDLSLPTLARLIQLTPSYLPALFRRETQHTLAEHITQARMQTALSLLKTTQLQIQTIAQLCGFNDPNYFGKQFKQHVGLTPQQYRHSQPR